MSIFKTPDVILSDLSKLMRKKRVLKGLTQQVLAKKSNVSISAVRKFEQTGQVSLESFIKIAYVLELTDTLLGTFEKEIQTPKSIDEIIKMQVKVDDDVSKKRRVRKM
jgi:transcriptional regulator with XRE-family HTH domain